jgi:hypothetical protein
VANTRDIKLDTRFFCLFKGDPGAGKSIAAASYPNPYFFDIDGRMKSVMNYWRPRGREFEYDRYTNFQSVHRRLEEFVAYCPFETLVYDGITSGADDIIDEMIRTRDSGKKRVVRAGIETAQIEDYGGESQGLKMIINLLKTISFRHNTNVIVTAHVLTTESTDLKSKVTTTSRTLLTAGKKVAAKLPKDFDEAYHFDVQSGFGPEDPPKYTIVTKNTGWDWAKTALPIPIRIDFTDGSLYDIIMKNLEGKDFVRAVNDPGDPNSVPPAPTLLDNW